MLVKALKKFFEGYPEYDGIVEGPMAHTYQDSAIREKISKKYLDHYAKIKTPLTDPLDYDPLDPPPGWAWDPYYEVWVRL